MKKPVKSPFKNYALNPARLPVPLAEFDLAKTLTREGSKNAFETKLEARNEDILRARQLGKSSLPKAKIFGAWLSNATQNKALPLSPASSVYMREVRRRMLSEVQRIFYATCRHPREIYVFTIVHPKWFYQEGTLRQCNPKKLKKRFLAYLERAGVTAADGMLFAGLHGEFDGSGYQLHYHGVVIGTKALTLKNISGNYGFVTTENIYRPVQIPPLVDGPRQLSYLVQSFWPYKKRYLDVDGKPRRQRRKSRIPSAQHEEILMWLAHQNLSDLIITNGIRLGKNGLVST